ncbi:MAG: hypothetical protein ACI9L9_000037, partial [Marivirga sp.]
VSRLFCSQGYFVKRKKISPITNIKLFNADN